VYLKHLVVELKHPKQPINEEVLSQIKRYAKAVANDERFKASGVEWDFLAVSNAFTEDAEMDARQPGKPRGFIIEYEEKTTKIRVIVVDFDDQIDFLLHMGTDVANLAYGIDRINTLVCDATRFPIFVDLSSKLIYFIDQPSLADPAEVTNHALQTAPRKGSAGLRAQILDATGLSVVQCSPRRSGQECKEAGASRSFPAQASMKQQCSIRYASRLRAISFSAAVASSRLAQAIV
jgi:hypothetical protein